MDGVGRQSSLMIERVARAIIGPGWELASSNDKRNARITARVAISSMREPTTGMLDAMSCPGGIMSTNPDEMRSAYREMIDVALSE